MASLIRGEDEQVVEDYYWYLLHSTAAHAFPEGILADKRYAWSDMIPHATGACNYAIMLRHMLVHENRDELHLLAAVPDWWLEEGQRIKVDRAPTYFGEVSFVIKGAKQGMQITLDTPKREEPKRIVLHLPKSRPLMGDLPGVKVVYRDNQTRHWDFPSVVEQYRKDTAAKNLVGQVRDTHN